MASRETRIKRVIRSLREHIGAEPRTLATCIVNEVGHGDVMGAKEVAAELGVGVANLRAVARLPEPITEVSATRLWDADEIRKFARERARKRAAEAGNYRKRKEPKDVLGDGHTRVRPLDGG